MKSNDYNNLKSRIIKASGGKITAADVEKIKKGNINAAYDLLSGEEKQMLRRILSDKAATKRILEDPSIKDILNGKKP